MNTSVLDKEGRALASFGSGDRNAAASRAQGRGGRANAPSRATSNLLRSARAAAAAPGRGRAARRELLQAIERLAERPRGGPRLSNRDVADLRARLNDLR